MADGLGVEVEVPVYRLHIANQRQIVDEAARMIRETILDYIESGLNPFGDPLPIPKDGGKPLDRTGAFLDSIKARVTASGKSGSVRATGVHDRGRSRGQSLKNDVLAKILHSRGVPVLVLRREDRLRIIRTLAPRMKKELVWTGRTVKRKL